jgi:hypothetical protein
MGPHSAAYDWTWLSWATHAREKQRKQTNGHLKMRMNSVRDINWQVGLNPDRLMEGKVQEKIHLNGHGEFSGMLHIIYIYIYLWNQGRGCRSAAAKHTGRVITMALREGKVRGLSVQPRRWNRFLLLYPCERGFHLSRLGLLVEVRVCISD